MRVFTLLLTMLLIESCNSFKEPEFIGLDNIRMGAAGVKSSSVNFDIHYFNPNKSKLQLKHAEGDAWLESTKLGHFIIDTLIRIPENSDFFLPVKLDVDMTYILKNALIGYLNKEVSVRIEGMAKVGKSGIFIHYPIHYEGKQNLSELIKLANTNQ